MFDQEKRGGVSVGSQEMATRGEEEGYAVKDETIEHARYVSVFCTANRHRLTGTEVLDLYRSRWQIELVFKRLKGIVGLGHLPKLNEESCRAWLYGKMFVALLTERLCREAQFFSPWGYPIEIQRRRRAQAEASAQSVAGEFEFWFMVIQHTILPELSIRECLANWPTIQEKLMENPRKRQPTLDSAMAILA